MRGDDGLDELTLATTTSVWWVRDGAVAEHRLDPERLGLTRQPTEALRGGDAAFNAQVVRDVFGGRRGPVRDAVVLNAGAALALTERDRGPSSADLEAGVRAGMDRAAAAIDSGAAARLVDTWVAATR